MSRLEAGRLGGGEPALLLDRDGVINLDHGYVATVERFSFCPGVFELARRAVDLGYRLVVVTNQSGIGRGYSTEAQFTALSRWLAARFAEQGAALTAIYHCPYLSDAVKPDCRRDSFWRKPNPGMILEAARRHHLDLARSVMVGDQPSDIAAAAAAGVGRRVLITAEPLPCSADPTLVASQLDQITAWLPAPASRCQ